MPAGSRLAVGSVAVQQCSEPSNGFCLTMFMVRSIRLNQITLKTHPVGAPQRTRQMGVYRDLPTSGSDYALPLWAAREGLTPDGRIIGGT